MPYKGVGEDLGEELGGEDGEEDPPDEIAGDRSSSGEMARDQREIDARSARDQVSAHVMREV